MNIEQLKQTAQKLGDTLPVLPLRDAVLFPHTMETLLIGRESSIAALQRSAQAYENLLLVVTQKQAEVDNPDSEALFSTATLAYISQQTIQEDKSVKALIEGIQRVRIRSIQSSNNELSAVFESLADKPYDTTAVAQKISRIKGLLDTLGQRARKTTATPQIQFPQADSLEASIDAFSAEINLSTAVKQKLLDAFDPLIRCDLIIEALENWIGSAEVERSIDNQVRSQMKKTQREYFLNEKMKAIQKELNSSTEDEFEALKERIENTALTTSARTKAKKELNRLQSIPQQSPEYSVTHHYLDTLLSLPWKHSSPTNTNLSQAQRTLDKAHYGLEEVKERIIEYLAVLHRVKDAHSPILCLVGPPGVGKTSLAKSIAEATGRAYIRMALGGIRDESEIRGHRRTYIGAMPGRILQHIQKTGVDNPLFLLDEIDKIGMDFRGDPAAALLEVLDPEQNNTFSDHYLEVEYDLSKVLFIATSNSINIPPALMDRMELIELSGYTDQEKIEIASKHLTPRQMQRHGLTKKDFKLPKTSVKSIIHNYTREPGVRELERKIAKLCRKTVTQQALNDTPTNQTINLSQLRELLGAEMYHYQGLSRNKKRIGQVVGLAWTQTGGDLLTIEVLHYTGSGKLRCTGKLGEVMKESIETALSNVKRLSEKLHVNTELFSTQDFHVHIPEGAIPKDGPSAGVALTLALASTLTQTPVLNNIAMTGEVTLYGDVLAIGGLKQKLLAAQRSGIQRVLIPQDNVNHLDKIPKEITNALEITTISTIEEAFLLAFSPPPLELKNAINDGKTVITH